MEYTEKQLCILQVLRECPCQTSKSIAAMIKRKFDITVTSASVTSFLRKLQAQGEASSSDCGGIGRVYWL